MRTDGRHLHLLWGHPGVAQGMAWGGGGGRGAWHGQRVLRRGSPGRLARVGRANRCGKETWVCSLLPPPKAATFVQQTAPRPLGGRCLVQDMGHSFLGGATKAHSVVCIGRRDHEGTARGIRCFEADFVSGVRRLSLVHRRLSREKKAPPLGLVQVTPTCRNHVEGRAQRVITSGHRPPPRCTHTSTGPSEGAKVCPCSEGPFRAWL